MLRIGIVGFGFMGQMHFNNYRKRDDVKICALCDANKQSFSGGGTAGNVAGTGEALDLSGIELFTDLGKMLRAVKLDALSIALPTDLHPDATFLALERGVNVLCEKPMALTLGDCDRMIAHAAKSGKILQIGHCVRFWPEYAKAKELVASGTYGKVLSASLRRLSLTPSWSRDNWLMNNERSGGVALDLHIHDTDYLNDLLGVPASVFSSGSTNAAGVLGHVMTQYRYKQNLSAFAEGGWLMAPTFGFEMSFNLVLERATIVYDCTRTPAFKVCPAEGEAFTPEVASGDGYEREIDHFLRAVKGEKVPTVTTLESSRDSVRVVLAELQSIETGKAVDL